MRFCAFFTILSARYVAFPLPALIVYSFATTVTYANGVSIESISKMLGHTKISTTQIYARIVDKTISDDMDKLAQKLSNTKFSANF